MKKIVMTIALFSAMMCACQNALIHSCDVTTDSISQVENYYTLFDFDMVDDVIWSPEDNAYHIEYDDPDAYDYEYLAYSTGRESWYGEYIKISLSNHDAQEFLDDWAKCESASTQIHYAISSNWSIHEVWTDGDVRFEIVHSEEE